MDNDPSMMREYCRDRIQQLKAELELLRDMIDYLERQAAGGISHTPEVTVKHAVKKHP